MSTFTSLETTALHQQEGSRTLGSRRGRLPVPHAGSRRIPGDPTNRTAARIVVAHESCGSGRVQELSVFIPEKPEIRSEFPEGAEESPESCCNLHVHKGPLCQSRRNQ